MAEELKNNTPEMIDDHSLISDYLAEYNEDKKYFEIALLIALIFHLALVWIKMPDFGSKQIVEEKKTERKVTRIVLPPPPEQKLEQLQIQKKVKKIPIPDPTPDEPEPVVPIETNVQQDTPETLDSEYMVGDLPDEPPVPTGPVSEATIGLEKPKYNLKQLMSNVVYPELGKKAGLQGTIIVQAVLRKDGTVGDVKVVAGNLRNYPFFRQAAINAVKKLKFTPGKLRGHPVDVIMTLTIRFRLKTNYSR